MWLRRLGEIAGGRTAPIDLIYVHPEFDVLVRQVPGMRVLAEVEIAFSEEDAGADVFGVREDWCAVYRGFPSLQNPRAATRAPAY